MSDRRLTPANPRVADTTLRGQIDAPRYSDGTPAQIIAPVTDLLREPGGARDRQLLLGAQVTTYEEDHNGHAFVRAQADGYVGYVSSRALGPVLMPTHRVSARATHAYAAPDFKSPDRLTLSLGARITVTGQADDRFCETPLGFVPTRHIAALDTPENDPVAVAERLLGTPYLWGGNSSFGIDCSGLIQIALLACDINCPGDSDLQERALGQTLPPGTSAQRGDLMFWKGHVAWVADPHTLLHANVHAMAVTHEPLAGALARIARTDGPVTRHIRLR